MKAVERREVDKVAAVLSKKGIIPTKLDVEGRSAWVNTNTLLFLYVGEIGVICFIYLPLFVNTKLYSNKNIQRPCEWQTLQIHIFMSHFLYPKIFPFLSNWLEVNVGVGTKNVCGHWKHDHIGQRLFM